MVAPERLQILEEQKGHGEVRFWHFLTWSAFLQERFDLIHKTYNCFIDPALVMKNLLYRTKIVNKNHGVTLIWTCLGPMGKTKCEVSKYWLDWYKNTEYGKDEHGLRFN